MMLLFLLKIIGRILLFIRRALLLSTVMLPNKLKLKISKLKLKLSKITVKVVF